MRRKITTDKIENSDLPELTGQQMKFVEGLLAGLTASDAYRSAYNCSNSKHLTIWSNASRLKNDTKVAAWLSAARSAGVGSARETLDEHLAELDRLKQIAISTGNVGAAVQAQQLKGKASGHYTDQIRDVTDREPTDILKELQAALSASPELAKLFINKDDDEITTEH